MKHYSARFSFFIFLILFFSNAVLAQSPVFDSLYQRLENTDKTNERIHLLNEISWEYKRFNLDSMWHYAWEAKRMAIATGNSTEEVFAYRNIAAYYFLSNQPDSCFIVAEKGIEMAEKAGADYELAKLNNLLGLVNKMHREYAEALDRFNKALVLFEALNDSSEISGVTLNIAEVYKTINDLPKAVELYIKALTIAEKRNDRYGIAVNSNNLANIYARMDKDELALEYFNKAIDYSKETFPHIAAASYHNSADLYITRGNDSLALNNLQRAIELNKAIDNYEWLANNYNLLGLYYTNNANYAMAEDYFMKEMEMRKITNDSVAIARTIKDFANLNIEKGNYTAAEPQLLQARDILSRNPYLREEMRTASLLYKVYKKQGKTTNALVALEDYVALKDSLKNLERQDLILELETRYETKKKEQENELLKQENLLHAAVIKQQRIYGIAIAVVALMAIFSAVVFFRSRQKQRKANIALQEKNDLINLQKEEITVQAENLQQLNDHLVAKNEQIEKQKNVIEESHQEITDSINYASRIQRAMLPAGPLLETETQGHFIFWKPRDVVSGDFYWVKKVNQYLLVAAADCTGHGVPGAFVSMLGISFLNEIARKKDIVSPAQVLEHLRDDVKKSLHQTHDYKQPQDGMDLAFVSIEAERKILQYAGANNALWLIRHNDKNNGQNLQKQGKPLKNGTHTLFSIKATRNPIGIYIKEKPFQNVEINYQPGDRIYMFSDGFPDQFGGTEDTKFGSKQFKQLLLEIQQHPMPQQKEILNQTLTEWMGTEHSQIDDILVVGLEL